MFEVVHLSLSRWLTEHCILSERSLWCVVHDRGEMDRLMFGNFRCYGGGFFILATSNSSTRVHMHWNFHWKKPTTLIRVDMRCICVAKAISCDHRETVHDMTDTHYSSCHQPLQPPTPRYPPPALWDNCQDWIKVCQVTHTRWLLFVWCWYRASHEDFNTATNTVTPCILTLYLAFKSWQQAIFGF